MCHGVECVGQRDDASEQRDLRATRPMGITATVPSFVMTHHALREVWVERQQRSQYVGTALGMSDDGAPFRRCQVCVLVNYVEERLVDFADVVKERDSLDDLPFMFVEISGIREDERVSGDASDMGASLGIVRVDGIEKGFHAGRGESLGGFTTAPFSEQVCASENTGGESKGGAHEPIDGKFRTFVFAQAVLLVSVPMKRGI